MKKRILACYLCLSLVLSCSVPCLAVSDSFSDVDSKAWYAQDVSDVQSLGIIQGVGDHKFNPSGTMTLAEAIAMASRTYAYCHSDPISALGDSPWYWPYVQYADQRGICTNGEFGTSYNLPCNRLTMAKMFSRALPIGADLETMNTVSTIPDVLDIRENDGIYLLYRIGVLAGNDKYGFFEPYKNVTRAEAAAILNRVVNKQKRKNFYLVPTPPIAGVYNCVSWIQTDLACGPIQWGPWGERITLEDNGTMVWNSADSNGASSVSSGRYTITAGKNITITTSNGKGYNGTLYGDLLTVNDRDNSFQATFARAGSKEEITIAEKSYKEYLAWRPSSVYNDAIQQAADYFNAEISGWYGFYLEDMNGDGVQELFVGLVDEPGIILAIYTMQNGHAVCVSVGDHPFVSEDSFIEKGAWTLMFRYNQNTVVRYTVSMWGKESIAAYNLVGTKLVKANMRVNTENAVVFPFFPW